MTDQGATYFRDSTIIKGLLSLSLVTFYPKLAEPNCAASIEHFMDLTLGWEAQNLAANPIVLPHFERTILVSSLS